MYLYFYDFPDSKTWTLHWNIGTGFVLNDTGGGGGVFAAVPVHKKNTVYILNL